MGSMFGVGALDSLASWLMQAALFDGWRKVRGKVESTAAPGKGPRHRMSGALGPLTQALVEQPAGGRAGGRLVLQF